MVLCSPAPRSFIDERTSLINARATSGAWRKGHSTTGRRDLPLMKFSADRCVEPRASPMKAIANVTTTNAHAVEDDHKLAGDYEHEGEGAARAAASCGTWRTFLSDSVDSPTVGPAVARGSRRVPLPHREEVRY